MTAEENFIRKVEGFWDTKFNDYDKKRFRLLLKEYREDLPSEPPVIVKRVVETVREFKPMLRSKTKDYKVSMDELMIIASELCLQRKVSINEFIRSKNGKCRNEISEVRKEFCKAVTENYKVQKQQLKLFFGVDHTTISFYIHGKKHRLITHEKATNPATNKALCTT